MTFHELGHIQTNHGIFRAKHKFRKRPHELSLTYPSGAKEKEARELAEQEAAAKQQVQSQLEAAQSEVQRLDEAYQAQSAAAQRKEEAAAAAEAEEEGSDAEGESAE